MNAHDVVHVPDLTLNLLSLAKIASHGKTIVFDKENCSVINRQVTIDDYLELATGTNKNGMYSLDSAYYLGCAVGNPIEEILWYKRFGYLNHYSMKLLKEGMTNGVTFCTSQYGFNPCEVCAKGKLFCKFFPKVSFKRTKDMPKRIHSDVCGPGLGNLLAVQNIL